MSDTSSAVSFAIVTPSYNQGHFLKDCINSILNQDWPHLEYRLMDAGSQDQTVSILMSYGKKLHWQSKPDKGQSDAINQGFAQIFKSRTATDQVICAYLNSDDYYLPQCFEKVARAFKAHPDKQWLIGDCQIINAERRPIQVPIKWYKKFWRLFLSPKLLTVLNPIPQPAVFFRATAWKKVGLFNENLRYTMDYDYWLRLYHECGTPIMLWDELAAFRVHGQSKGGSQFITQFNEEAQVAQKHNPDFFLRQAHLLHNWLIKTIYQMIK